MKKFLLAGLLTVMIISGSIRLVEAAPIVQNFTNSWSVDVWDYYGYIAAIQWQYQPYNASTDALTSVELSMNINVSEMTVGDDFRYRAAFFTGWDPDVYQFSSDEWFKNVASTDLTINRDYLFTSVSDLNRWTNPTYGPVGNYYFESTTLSNSHTVNVSTQLTYNYEPIAATVPEPSTILLLGSGIFGLAVWRKRHMQ